MLIAAMASAVCGGCSPATNDRSVKYVSVAEASRMIRATVGKADQTDLIVIDPRPAAQFAQGHIPGAKNITIAEVPRDRKDRRLEKFDEILIYGNDPGSAVPVAMAKRLLGAKHDDIRVIEGGLLAWRAQGGEVAK